MGMHTATYKGRPVRIRLRSGGTIDGAFVERPKSHRCVVIDVGGRLVKIPIREIASFYPIKGGGREPCR